MVGHRSKSRHSKRLAIALCLLFVAGAVGVSQGGNQHHQGAGALKTLFAGGGDGSGGGAGAHTATGGAGGQGGGGAGLPGRAGTVDAFGPAEGGDASNLGAFMPNGENGLMALADFARTQGLGGGGENSINNSDNTPGLPPGSLTGDAGGPPDRPEAPSAGGPGEGSPHGDGPPLALGNPGGGFGFGGGGGGGGAVGSGGGTGGGHPQTPPGSGPTPPGSGPTPPDTGPTIPDTGPTIPDLGPHAGPPTGPSGGGDGGGGPKACVVSLLDTCGQPPTDTPFTFTPPTTDQPPVNGPQGGDPPGGNVQILPEPAAWLMMILGFVAAGSTLRARRRDARRALA
jgi:hypothetical protein